MSFCSSNPSLDTPSFLSLKRLLNSNLSKEIPRTTEIPLEAQVYLGLAPCLMLAC